MSTSKLPVKSTYACPVVCWVTPNWRLWKYGTTHQARCQQRGSRWWELSRQEVKNWPVRTTVFLVTSSWLMAYLSNALECLCRVAAWTLDINRALQPVNVVNFNSVFTMDVITRLRKIEAVSNLGSVINLATANPQELHSKSKFITMMTSKDPKTSRFFGVGTVAYSALLSNDKSRQVCLHFSDRIFPRLVAVLGSVLREQAVYMGSYYNGVSIGTSAKTGNIVPSFYRILSKFTLTIGGPSPTKGVGPSSPSKSRGRSSMAVPSASLSPKQATNSHWLVLPIDILPCDANS